MLRRTRRVSFESGLGFLAGVYQLFLDFWQGGANFPRLFCRGVRCSAGSGHNSEGGAQPQVCLNMHGRAELFTAYRVIR